MSHTLKLLTVEEVARLTRRTPSAVRQAIARRRLPAVRLGKRLFVDAGYLARKFREAERAVETVKET